MWLSVYSRMEYIEDYLSSGQMLDPEDEAFLFSRLTTDKDPRHIAKATVILTNMDKAMILRVLDVLKDLSLSRHRIVLPLLMPVHYTEVFDYCFHLLRTTTDEFSLFVITCLSHTEYCVLPFIIRALEDASPVVVQRIQNLLRLIGFEALKPYLMVFPVIPHEKVFRDVFGVDQIRSVYFGVSPKTP